MPMPLEILATFEDGSRQLYYIPVDLMFGSKKFNKDVVVLDSWKWVSSDYSFFINEQEKTLVSLEIDPSKRLADINQDDNFFEISK